MSEKLFEITGEEYVGFSAGNAYVVSGGGLQFSIWERKEDVVKVLDSLNDLYNENEELRQDNNDYSYKADWKSAVAEIETFKDEIIFLKNELEGFTEENTELKKQIDVLEAENEQLKQRNKYNLEDCGMEIAELRKENEELREKIEKASDMLNEIDFFSTDAVTHDTIAYREMTKFDNKDAHSIACNLKDARQILEGVSNE